MLISCCTWDSLGQIIGVVAVLPTGELYVKVQATPDTNNQLIAMVRVIHPWENFWPMKLAHEVGHNLVMKHDFDSYHGGSEGPCDGEGFMSYGNHKSQWSECSVKDFNFHRTIHCE